MLCLQVAVAVMQRMAISQYDDAASAARKFSKALHDSWGVGDASCGDGILLLLSVEDRQVLPAPESSLALIGHSDACPPLPAGACFTSPV